MGSAGCCGSHDNFGGKAMSKNVHKPIVVVEFYDHEHINGEIDDTDPMHCEVFGRLVNETDRVYVVASWISNRDIRSHNNETFKILKRDVISKKVLRG
jgi:hypothetical protein